MNHVMSTPKVETSLKPGRNDDYKNEIGTSYFDCLGWILNVFYGTLSSFILFLFDILQIRQKQIKQSVTHNSPASSICRI